MHFHIEKQLTMNLQRNAVVLYLLVGLLALTGGCSKKPNGEGITTKAPDRSTDDRSTDDRSTDDGTSAARPNASGSSTTPRDERGDGDSTQVQESVTYQKRDSGRFRESRFLRVHDGFISADSPKTVAADEATFLRDDDEVVGFVIDGEARAYSVRMLAYHHVVNDQIGKTPLTVTY